MRPPSLSIFRGGSFADSGGTLAVDDVGEGMVGRLAGTVGFVLFVADCATGMSSGGSGWMSPCAKTQLVRSQSAPRGHLSLLKRPAVENMVRLSENKARRHQARHHAPPARTCAGIYFGAHFILAGCFGRRTCRRPLLLLPSPHHELQGPQARRVDPGLHRRHRVRVPCPRRRVGA